MTFSAGKPRRKRDPNWVPKPISARQLEWAAQQYLQRYIPTETQIRRVLTRRVHKNWRARGDKVTEEERLQGMEMVEKQMKSSLESRQIKDDQVAVMWVEHWINKGKSTVFIRQKLREKGVDSTIIDQSIEEVYNQMADPSLQSAITYAKKRRFGVFRNNPGLQIERKQKDMAAMVRAGHSYDVVKKILECTSIDEIKDLLE